MSDSDVIIIGAGAAGLMCAAAAARRGRAVRVLEQAAKPGIKVRMSGGGRCNFTNYDVGPEHYLSRNRHFVKSALSRFTQWDFLALVERYRIPWHEREHGRLFCNGNSKAILDLLLAECRDAGAIVQLQAAVDKVARADGGGFVVHGPSSVHRCASLVVATGGLSIPKMGAGPFGYRIAEQFGMRTWPPSPGLVPLTLHPQDRERLAPLAGIAVPAVVETGDGAFHDHVLFTHRGLSGPAILQASNYWEPGAVVTVDWLPGESGARLIEQGRRTHPNRQLKTVLGHRLPARLVAALLPPPVLETPLAQLSNAQLETVSGQLHQWRIVPGGTEGYRTAEVTRGGVDCDAVSSQTLESRSVPGLYFIGEVLDVTGWLGGYNLQWAWSSGWCAGQYV